MEVLRSVDGKALHKDVVKERALALLRDEKVKLFFETRNVDLEKVLDGLLVPYSLPFFLRESVRSFEPTKIPVKILKLLLLLVQLSPKASGKNTTRWYIVDEKEGLEKIRIEMTNVFNRNMEERTRELEKEGKKLSLIKKEMKLAKIFFESSTVFFTKAPYVAFVTMDLEMEAKFNDRIVKLNAPTDFFNPNYGRDLELQNASAQQSTLEFCLTALGLGSCRVNSGNPLITKIEENIKKYLPYDLREELVSVMPFGYKTPRTVGE